jgi:hypothetical protein
LFVSALPLAVKEKPLNRRPISRPILLVFALIFLFETWIWDSLSWGLGWIAQRIPWARIKRGAQDIINRLPAIFAVLLFGVPVVVMELGSFFSVVAIALGHVILGSICYAMLKLIGVSLIAVIYDLTQEKLMTLRWFVWLHGKFARLHEIAHEYVAPYREAALAQLRAFRARAFAFWNPQNSGLGRLRRWVRARRGGSLTPDPEFD